ncbi:bifunctional demethylmenaquinone methyltransferase/2-methoxy-6-polyprenyl-1,4-benzoquinol methylase UbiE [bacterium]|nr:bifunctional demethylmenaquinone methyltransferase/2-methoxy-6-polyprenyl-1,4-benzoquinol methylase UbiE [bacterium]
MPDASKVRSLFDELAPSYDHLNRIFSLGMDVGWRKQLVAAVARQNPTKVLDLACGSGDVAEMLQKSLPRAQVVGLDFSRLLLTQAKERGLAELTEADALRLPFADESFDAVTIAFGLRNFSDRTRGLKEIARVLKKGAVFGLLEFSPPPMPWKIFWNLYLKQMMPLVAQFLTRQGDSFRYLAQSIAEFPTPSALNHELSSVGLKLLFSRSFSARLVMLTVCVRG